MRTIPSIIKNHSTVFVFSILLWTSCENSEGKKLYVQYCAQCHMDDGSGLVHLIPSFENKKFIGERAKLVCKILQGSKDTIELKNMPHYMMSDVQISNILNYIAQLKKMDVPPFTDSEVRSHMETCK